MRNIRVLHIFNPSLKTRFGGQNVTWKYNFNSWDNPGVEHFCLNVESNQVESAIKFFRFEYPSEQPSLISRVERLLWINKLFRGLRKYSHEYDILHFHVLWWGGLLAAHWAKKRNIPTIYESVLLGADTPGDIKHQQIGNIKVNLLKDFSRILAISDFLAQDYLENGFSQGQVATLMNSVDTTLFHPVSGNEERNALRKQHGLPMNSTILIFVGSIIHRKGVDILIEAFKQMSLSNPDLYLLLVGPNNKQENPSLDENWIRSLQENLKAANLTSKVNFLGLVSDRKPLAELYMASDVFIFPSRKEGLGNVILEAMASGLPVIVSDLEVFEGLIKNDVNGLTVPVEDASALAKAGTDLVYYLDQRERYSNKAREDTLKYFSFPAWQAKLVEIYHSLIRGQNT